MRNRRRTLWLSLCFLASIGACSNEAEEREAGPDAFLSDSPMRPYTGGAQGSEDGGWTGSPPALDLAAPPDKRTGRGLDTFAARRGDVLFVARPGRGPQAVDLTDPAAPRRLGGTWPAGAVAALDVVDDTLVAVSSIDARGVHPRVRVETWDVSGFTGGAAERAFPVPTQIDVDGVFAGLFPVGSTQVLATIEGVPGTADPPVTALRTLTRAAAGQVVLGDARRFPHFTDTGSWIAPRLLRQGEDTLWVASIERLDAWQTRFVALDAATPTLAPRADRASFVVPGVVDAPGAVQFGADTVDCLTVATPGYTSEGPVVFVRVRLAADGGAAEVSPAFEWPKTEGVRVRRPLLLTPTRAFVLFSDAEHPERTTTVGVLDTSDPAAPRVGGRVEVPGAFWGIAAGARLYGAGTDPEGKTPLAAALDATDAQAPTLVGGAPRALGPAHRAGGVSASIALVDAAPWVRVTETPCTCRPPTTRTFPLTDALLAGAVPDATPMEGGAPRVLAWGARTVAVGAEIRALDVPGARGLPLAVPVSSAVIEGDDVVRAGLGAEGVRLDRVPLAALGAGDEAPYSASGASPSVEGACDAPCQATRRLLPPYVAPDGTTPLGITAHGSVDTSVQRSNDSNCEMFERFAPGTAGREAPVSQGCIDWNDLGLTTKAGPPTPTPSGYAYPVARVSGRGADAVTVEQLAVVDLRGPAPRVTAFPLEGDDVGPILARGDLLVTSHALPSGERFQFFLDRVDFTEPDAPVALPPLSVPGRVLDFDSASGRLLAAEYVQVPNAPGGARVDTRFHAVQLVGGRAESVATVLVENVAVRALAPDDPPRLAARTELRGESDYPTTALLEVTGWRAGETLTVRDHALPEALGPLYEWRSVGGRAVLRGTSGLVVADLAGEAPVFREIPTAGWPPDDPTGDARALLLPLGEDGLRVVPFAAP